MKKWLTPKSMSILLTIIYVGSLIPLFLIARYNYPSADDYSIGETCRHAWVSSHNVFAVIWQAVLMAVDDYFNWMGYFSSIFFMSVHPGVFGEQWYSLTTWIMVGMLSFSTIYLFHAIMVKALKMDKYRCHCISMIVLFVMIQCMVGRVEAFYWFCGAVNYIFLHSAGMFMLGALISAVYDAKRGKKIWDLVIASVMGIWAGAGNYMTALIICIVLVVATGFMVYQKTWKKYKMLFIPMGCYLLAFMASAFAPGNNVRADGASGMNPVKAIMVSFYYVFDLALSEWTNWVVVLMVIVLIPLFWKATAQATFTFRYPLVVVAFSFCVLAATVTPPIFAVGNIMAGRLQALMYIMYILLLALNVGYVVGWAQKRLSFKTENKLNMMMVVGACSLLFVFGSLLTVIAEPHYFTCSSAVTDLRNGSAKAYGDALKERAAILKAAEEDAELVFEALPAQPRLLYFDDITKEKDDWENRAVSRYYNVRSVALK